MMGSAQASGGPSVTASPGILPARSDARAGSRSATRAVALRQTRGVLEKAVAALQGSPGQLRIAGIACVLACLAFAVLADWGLQMRASALSDARSYAQQLVRIQQIASDLVVADSQFTNGYLTFGQDSPAQLAGYDQAVRDASGLIAEAAQAEPADAAALATVNEKLTQYTARVAEARANNRQGFQVGIGYLRQANALLQSSSSGSSSMQPLLDSLVRSNSARVDDAFAASLRASWLFTVSVLLGLGVLLVAQVWLAVRTHRVFNIPLVAATSAVLLAALAGGVVMVAAQSKADEVRGTSYAATRALANARIDAYVGKSYESIALIYIGTGGEYAAAQKASQARVSAAKSQLAVATAAGAKVGSAELAGWASASDALDAAAQSDWIAASGKAVATTPGSVNALFAAFDSVTHRALQRQAAAVSDGLASNHALLVVLGWAALLLGVAAAGASWLGTSLRLEEYR
jgi:hypothetical protein